jgi:glycosyltransferase involved in cell wall biosynthesis
MPKYSVIVLCYNQEQFIAELMSSLLRQKYQDVEFIVSDDCSTDNSWEIIDAFNDSRLIKIKQKRNLGINAHSNYLLSRASGNYIFSVGGDDYLLGDDFFLISEEMISRYPDIDCWVIGKKSFLDKPAPPAPNFKFDTLGINLIKDVILGKVPFFLFQQVIFRNPTPRMAYPFQKNKYSYGEDIDLLFSMLKGLRCAPIAKTMVFYRLGVGVTAQANKTLEGYHLHNLMIRRWVREKYFCNFTKFQSLYVLAREYLRVENEFPNGSLKKKFIRENFKSEEVLLGMTLALMMRFPGVFRRFFKSFL